MKNKTLFYFIGMSILLLLLLGAVFFLNDFYFSNTFFEKLVISILVSLFALADIVILLTSFIMIKYKRENIRKSFDFYIEEQMATTGIGVIIYNNDTDIIWASKFIENRMSRNVVGRKLLSISDKFSQSFLEGQKKFTFETAGVIFEAEVNIEKKTVVLKDVTNENTVLKQYIAEKLVIGELEIDNYQQFQVTLAEDELFRVQSAIIKVLDKLAETYNLVYRQYVNGKFVFFTNQESLDALVAADFDFLEMIRSTKTASGISVSASVGFGSGTSNQKELTDLAREGLRLAQSRGGDQISLMVANRKPQYFGSKIEISKSVSRVKIKQTAALFETKIQSPNIKNVIVYGHQFADLDAVGAALGVVEIAKTYKKEVFVQNITFDDTTKNAIGDTLNKDEVSVFIKPSKATTLTTKNSIVVIVDTADVTRIENKDALKKVDPENVFIFDHHRTFEAPKGIPQSNIFIDTGVSSATEIIVDVIAFLERRINLRKSFAQMMLNGIYLDTKIFTKSAGGGTYSAAAYLESRGAQSSISANCLKIPVSASAIINKINSNLEEVIPGFFIASYDEPVGGDVISMAADEILRTQDRKAAFVIAKVPNQNMYKMSARGNDTNVQIIAEEVGGGGHFAASAAVSKESLPIFLDNIRLAIKTRGVK